jgi:uncharacterized protein YdeI (YjbR/CyaY-like superfamily)
MEFVMPTIPRETKPGKTKGPVLIPEELRAALAGDEAAWKAFDRLPPSHQREVAGYVAEAKKSETRARRATRMLSDLKSGRIGAPH